MSEVLRERYWRSPVTYGAMETLRKAPNEEHARLPEQRKTKESLEQWERTRTREGAADAKVRAGGRRRKVTV